MTVRPLVWVGIEVGKTTHRACATDASAKVMFSQKLANDQAAIEALVARAAQTATEVRWAIDLTSNAATLLVALLTATEAPVVYVPGRVLNRMTGVFRGEATSDAKDARMIAETARIRAELSPVTATDELLVELRTLTSHREDLTADWVRGVNRLRDLLAGVFPALERSFDYSTRTALILLTGF